MFTFSITSLLAANSSLSTVASRRAMDDTRSESEGTKRQWGGEEEEEVER